MMWTFIVTRLLTSTLTAALPLAVHSSSPHPAPTQRLEELVKRGPSLGEAVIQELRPLLSNNVCRRFDEYKEISPGMSDG